MSTLIKFNSRNDTYGNPRRLWAELSSDTGELLAVYPEGYLGFNAVPSHLREKAKRCYSVQITVNSYESIKRHGRFKEGA